MATGVFAQNLPSNQESGDIFANVVRVNAPDCTATISSPFNMGFVNSPTGDLLSAVFAAVAQPTAVGGGSYNPDVIIGYEYAGGLQSQSGIGFDFLTFNVDESFDLQSGAVTMYAYDYIPCIETWLPKGTYTFQATATPLGANSTPGFFVFATQTQGIWTTQFSLALPKPEGATRTLTFAHAARVRWMLVNQAGNVACAAITAKYYNSGN
jgi:hypothetical protein